MSVRNLKTITVTTTLEPNNLDKYPKFQELGYPYLPNIPFQVKNAMYVFVNFRQVVIDTVNETACNINGTRLWESFSFSGELAVVMIGFTCLTQADVVLVHDELPRNKWSLSITEKIITCGDGLIRSARVRTKVGITTRPITKLYPLEINCDE